MDLKFVGHLQTVHNINSGDFVQYHLAELFVV